MTLPESPPPLPRPVVDSHTHLDATRDKSGLDPEEALRLATAAGVPKVVQIGCDPHDSRWAVEAAERWPAVVAGVAIHPNDAARMAAAGGRAALDAGLAVIGELAARPGVRAVGETGLDFFRTPDAAGQEVQRESFAAHIELARAHAKALVIHDRDAHREVLQVLDEVGVPDRFVMHCFSGDVAFARECLDRGGYLSFAGTVTFTNNAPLQAALDACPLDRVLVETDAPYLTPMPLRGRPNASYLMPHTVRFMAERLGVSLETMCDALSANAYAAFGGEW